MRAYPSGLFHTIAIRVTAGAAGVLPPLLTFVMLDRAEYGHAMANYAIALLLLGPMEQFLSQGYLRALLAERVDLTTYQPDGIGLFPVYVFSCVFLVFFLGDWLGLSVLDRRIIPALVCLVSLCRVQERWFIALGLQSAAIIYFYLIPPLGLTILIVCLRPLLHISDFLLVSVAQILVYIGCAAVSFAALSHRGFRPFLPKIPLTLSALQRDISAVKHFVFSGALLSAAEQLPVIFLKAFGLSEAIPAFEIARKISSAPGVAIHAIHIQLGTEIVRKAGSQQPTELSSYVRHFILITVAIAVIYFPLAITLIALGNALYPDIVSKTDFLLAVLVSCSAAVTALSSTAGSVLVALRGDEWWSIGAFLGLAVQIAISILLINLLASLAIGLAVLGQSVVLNGIVIFAAMLLWRKRANLVT